MQDSNQKIVQYVLIFASIIIVAVLIISGMLNNNGQYRIPDRILTDLNVVECGFVNEKEAYSEAISTADLNVCNCIEDMDLNSECTYVVYDLALYNQALGQSNPNICNEIQEEGRKEACIDTVETKVAYLKENDPQTLADDYLFTHNDNAVEVFEELVAQNPEDLDSLIALALVYAEQGLKEQEQGGSQTPYIEKAFAVIEKMKQIDPEDSDIYSTEGYVYEIKPDYEKAIDSYNKAIELDAQNLSAYTGKGHTYNMMGNLRDALSSFKTADRMDTDNVYLPLYSQLCRLEAFMGLTRDSIKHCQVVITSYEIDPLIKSEALQVVANMFLKSGNLASAENYLLQAKILAPSDPNLYIMFARLYSLKEDYMKTEVSARKVIDLAPNKTAGYQELAHALYGQGEFEDAIDMVQKALNLINDDVSLLDPNKPTIQQDLYYIMEACFMELGDENNADKYKKLGDKIKV